MGASSSESGSGANYLCLHAHSFYAQYNDQDQNGARLYGYEYEVGGLTGMFANLNDREVCMQSPVSYHVCFVNSTDWLFSQGGMCCV